MSGGVDVVVATILVSLISLVGLSAVSLKERTLDRILFFLVAFSAGSILGTAYFDLLPEAVEVVEGSLVYLYVTVGFVLFFFLERFIYWYHGHPHEADMSEETVVRASTKAFAYLNIIGDGIHNFVDGMIIAASFLLGFSVGLATTIAVVFHELPQEMGDYGILIYGGFKRKKALILNFIAASSVVFGGIVAIFLLGTIEALKGLLVAFSTGGFIYLAASELIPELQKEKSFKKSVIQFTTFILGIALIWSLGTIFPV